MIVNDDMVGVSLDFLNDDATTEEIHYAAYTAENDVKEVYSRLFLSFNAGTVAEREARAICNPEYREAKEREARAVSKLAAHKQRDRGAGKICDIWQTERADIRAAERVR